MNSRQRRKLEAERHNKRLDDRRVIELDRKQNPEKYRRVRPGHSRTEAQRLAVIIGCTAALI